MKLYWVHKHNKGFTLTECYRSKKMAWNSASKHINDSPDGESAYADIVYREKKNELHYCRWEKDSQGAIQFIHSIISQKEAENLE